MRRIAILGHGFITWEGGITFLRLLIGALKAVLPVNRHKIYLFLPLADRRLPTPDSLESHWRAFTARFMNKPEMPTNPIGLDSIADSLQEFWKDLIPVAVGHEPDNIVNAYRMLKLDAVLPAMFALPPHKDISWVGYVYDFQHRHLPHLFRSAEIAGRDAQFKTTLTTAKSIIVNAQAVVDDIQRFADKTSARIFNLPFCTNPPALTGLPEWKELQTRYLLSSSYFAICNQFWQHKDHLTAFRALALLARDFPHLTLACTGPTNDYRDPGYMPRLMAQVAELGLQNRIRVLGSIPKVDQMGILNYSRAMVQPTLFEGGRGGGALIDAMSLGIESIVSDISVNREISHPSVTLFEAGNPENLARVMRNLLSRPPQQRPTYEQLSTAAHDRRRHCGETLLQALDAAGMTP